jgi:hexokinase
MSTTHPPRNNNNNNNNNTSQGSTPFTATTSSSHSPTARMTTVPLMDDIEAMFDVSPESLGDLIQGFGDEMKTGLANGHEQQKPSTSDLKMIPSYVTGKQH